jgi:hypothetical protein
MKPQTYIRYLQTGETSPVDAAEVCQAATELVEKHGTAGVAELAAAGQLREALPFAADLPAYDPAKARRRPVPA